MMNHEIEQACALLGLERGQSCRLTPRMLSRLQAKREAWIAACRAWYQPDADEMEQMHWITRKLREVGLL